ncbi:tRNA (guanine(46)-N(7))-methyltransferase TrmB [Chlamydia sp. 17-3921]|uniref:tRNA (guanine(46)-N(7))-methyltransferase TrmB n=1 Tax=Chlamydia sp. 17-3921 TaxID=2675798 RepID=UPI00191B8355|nr:tRNA (guanine(46)-N(7))-methyltransferase TrmB [Chlamydia sp. 17-3921]
MKPRDLNLPFTWEERSPCIDRGVLFVPKHYSDHYRFATSLWEKMFFNELPIACELCSGNGDWIVAQAQIYPQINWIAVEQRFDRVRKIWSKMSNSQITNLRIVYGTAETFFQYYVPSEALERIVINFPDPWPKQRHRKRRLFHPEFVKDLVKVMQNKAALILATDEEGYLKEAIEVLKQSLTPILPEPYYCRKLESYGGSWFENLWRSKGLSIFYTEFVKNVGI